MRASPSNAKEGRVLAVACAALSEQVRHCVWGESTRKEPSDLGETLLAVESSLMIVCESPHSPSLLVLISLIAVGALLCSSIVLDTKRSGCAAKTASLRCSAARLCHFIVRSGRVEK